MILRCLTLFAAASVARCNDDTLYYDQSCWGADFAQKRECCRMPTDECFNEEFNRNNCCGSCLPLAHADAQFILKFSSLVGRHRLSVSARPSECELHGGHNFYAVVRIGALWCDPLTDARSSTLAALDAKEKQEPQGFVPAISLQTLMICAPGNCWSQEECATVAGMVAEQTIRGCLSKTLLIDFTLIYCMPLADVRIPGSRPTSADVPSASAALEAVPCRGNACASLLGIGGARAAARATTVVIDIGAFNESEFLGWLDKGGKDGRRRFVIALEPDPMRAAQHPARDGLALLEAAAGEKSVGQAPLHRSANGLCSSLLPLQSDPKEFSQAVKLTETCFAPPDDGEKVVQVHVLALEEVLAALPAEQEVAMLKVDAQGHDLAAVRGAGAQLRRVRRIQVELVDLDRGHPLMPYGPEQPSKDEVVIGLLKLGFLLDGCQVNVAQLREENCLFVRKDLIEEEPSDDVAAALSGGQLRWDRPGFDISL